MPRFKKKKKDLGGKVPGCCVLLGNFFFKIHI